MRLSFQKPENSRYNVIYTEPENSIRKLSREAYSNLEYLQTAQNAIDETLESTSRLKQNEKTKKPNRKISTVSFDLPNDYRTGNASLVQMEQ